MADPFDVLGVEARFDLDARALEARHRELSKTLHPDRYAGKPAAERRMALGRAIDVNDAYRIVRDPIRRAEALLRRADVAVGEIGEPKASPALLMETLEAREALSDAAASRDLGAVAALADSMRAKETMLLAALGERFAAAAENHQRLTEVLPTLGELRYVRRFLDEVGAIEERLAG